jgi:hypothetical protein
MAKTLKENLHRRSCPRSNCLPGLCSYKRGLGRSRPCPKLAAQLSHPLLERNANSTSSNIYRRHPCLSPDRFRYPTTPSSGRLGLTQPSPAPHGVTMMSRTLECHQIELHHPPPFLSVVRPFSASPLLADPKNGFADRSSTSSSHRGYFRPSAEP